MTPPVHGVLPEINPASDVCQRWNNRQHSWVRRSAGGFNPDQYTVAPITETEARSFTIRNHYAGTYPAASKRFGLLDTERSLLGVAVFGIPAQAKVLTNVFPTLTPYKESLELSRFVLLDGPPGNTESWFLARCFTQLAQDGVRGIVSFADPVPRAVNGQLLFPGHVGTIYQASNARYTGRGTARTITLINGVSISDRALQKVRRGEQGHEYVERRLIAAGARQMRGATGAAWLVDALDDVGAVRLKHRGCLRYAMVTNRWDRRLLTPGLAYPKQADAA